MIIKLKHIGNYTFFSIISNRTYFDITVALPWLQFPWRTSIGGSCGVGVSYIWMRLTPNMALLSNCHNNLSLETCILSQMQNNLVGMRKNKMVTKNMTQKNCDVLCVVFSWQTIDKRNLTGESKISSLLEGVNCDLAC